MKLTSAWVSWPGTGHTITTAPGAAVIGPTVTCQFPALLNSTATQSTQLLQNSDIECLGNMYLIELGNTNELVHNKNVIHQIILTICVHKLSLKRQ